MKRRLIVARAVALLVGLALAADARAQQVEPVESRTSIVRTPRPVIRVDGHYQGVVDGSIVVPCGVHAIDDTRLLIPCGGEITYEPATATNSATPRALQPVPAETEMRNSGLAVGGIIFLSIGGAVATLSGVASALCGFGNDEDACVRERLTTAGIALGVGLVLGLPLIIYGATRVPASKPDPPSAFRFRFTGLATVSF